MLALVTVTLRAQTLPASLRSYLDRNYRGWRLAGECYPKAGDNTRVLVGDFDGNGRKDYAVKFIRKGRGFFMAFLSHRGGWKPYYLHIWNDPNEARYSDLLLFENGGDTEYGPRKLKYDAPADFHCESDVGGVHVYRNGKFIAY